MAGLGTRKAGALLLLGLLAQAAPSRAEKNPPAPPDTTSALAPKLELEGPEAEAKDRARELFQQGVLAYRAGKFYEAVDIFLATQRIYPDTQLCFNVARAYENLGNTAAALRYYRDYLRRADRPSDGDEVRERVRRLEQQLAQRGVMQLSVLSQPEAATVLLDGKAVGITPFTVETYPGKHRLALSLDGHVPQEQVIEIDPHTSRDVSMVLLPVPKAAPQTPHPVGSDRRREPNVRLPTLVTLGTGLTLLGAALVAEAATRESGLSRTTAFFAGSGLGVTSVGGVMLYFDLSPSPSRTQGSPPARQDSATAAP